MANKVTLPVPPDKAGQRLDNFLLSALKVPRGLIYKLLRKGAIRVNGKKAKPTHRINPDDEISAPAGLGGDSTEPVALPADKLALMQGRILHEHADFLAVDKPAGMAVHAGSGLPWGLIDLMRELVDQKLELAHRLDRDTSGVLLLARHHQALRELNRLFAERELEKRYLTLLHGRLPQELLEVDLALDTEHRIEGERTVAITDAGRPASTEFRVLEAYRDASLVEATIGTGRTHQIRVHAKAIGHPVAGDRRYGDADLDKRLGKKTELQRLFLHGSSLRFPWQDDEQLVTAPLPEELRAALDRL